jgi:hypothetical protein
MTERPLKSEYQQRQPWESDLDREGGKEGGVTQLDILKQKTRVGAGASEVSQSKCF